MREKRTHARARTHVRAQTRHTLNALRPPRIAVFAPNPRLPPPVTAFFAAICPGKPCFSLRTVPAARCFFRPGVAFRPAFPGKAAPTPGFSAPASRQNTRFAPRLPPFCPSLPGGSPPRCGFRPVFRLPGRLRGFPPRHFSPRSPPTVFSENPAPNPRLFSPPPWRPPREPRIPGSDLEKTAAPSRVKFREISPRGSEHLEAHSAGVVQWQNSCPVSNPSRFKSVRQPHF